MILGGAVLSLVGVVVAITAIFALRLSPAMLCVLLSVAALFECAALRVALGKQQGWIALQYMFGFAGVIGLVVSVVLAVAVGDG
jgi:hypothetical protein